MVRLQAWDKGEGRGRTFQDLALRLQQLGRRDLADRLADAVLGEKEKQVGAERQIDFCITYMLIGLFIVVCQIAKSNICSTIG